MKNLAFKNLSYRLFERAIRRIMGILASKTVLKICHKSSFKYLTAEDIAKNTVKSSKIGPKVKDSSNLSI